MKLIIVRHGETFENENGICQGQTEGELSEKGIIQSIQLANELKKYNINRIYSSPLGRAIKTACYIQNHFNKLKINTDKRLIERNLGPLQGKVFPTGYNYFNEYEGAESIQKIVNRTHSFVNELPIDKSETILVVSHGITIIAFIAVLNNITVDRIHTIPLVENASISEYVIHPGYKPEIVKINYTKHLFQK